jgi:hypothetical protein
LIEKDDTKSTIRIIDRVTRVVAAPEAPETMEAFEHEMTLFIRFKSGWARGPFSLKLDAVKPSGDGTTLIRQAMNFEGEEDRGIDIVLPMRMRIEMPGIYWFEVRLAEKLVTRVPFRVIYAPAITPRAGAAGGSL